jgi:uncharacterized protein
MALFLLVYLFVYGGMHYVAYRKLIGVYKLASFATACIVLFMGVMVSAPVLVRVAERAGQHEVALALAHFGYLWMGVLFIFLSVFLLVDGLCLLIQCGRRLCGRKPGGCRPRPRTKLLLAVAGALLIAGYGFWEALDIRTETVVVATAKLPQSAGRFTIVQISDVHVGLIVREARLRRIAREIDKVRPDLIVSTGDLVDGQLDSIEGLATVLAELRPPAGKFAVTGNHEYYAGIDNALLFTRAAGFNVLQGSVARVGKNVALVGFDDPAGSRTAGNAVRERDVLKTVLPNTFTVVLKHRPKVDPASIGLFDLQLSGHVHKGQIAPFTIFTSLFYPVKSGLSRLDANASLYVSRGTGTWGPPIRFLAPPEITVIHVVPVQ